MTCLQLLVLFLEGQVTSELVVLFGTFFKTYFLQRVMIGSE